MTIDGHNRLAQESSPYLLQHAANPVHWRAWGEEAFAEARARNVPIFLSIGYSTCYWCHVMERESFEDARTASVMNERFVCVKVDREERPDVDEIYMAATVTLSGRGGWPMSVFLEPGGLRPFWAGTYFPPEPRSGMPSFTQVLEGMSDAYAQRRDEVLEQSEKLAGAVREQLATAHAPVPVGRNQIVRAVQTLLRMHDRTHGGFGGAPKFPQPVFAALLLELRGVVDEQTRSAIDGALSTTLDRMDAGGVHDQVGGGFHRYAVDETWTVPHFEKMLYDQAQLASVYTRAAVELGHAGYERVARRTLEYVLREVTGPEGGFYSAQDAEVDGREGLNYLWNAEELVAALGDNDGAWVAEVYGVARGPNFRDPHDPEAPASNVLRLDAPIGDRAERLDALNAQLLEARDRRKQPHLDDKVLASWNGMMVSALAEAAVAFDEDRYRTAALRAVAFLRDTFVDDDGAVGRSWRGGVTSGEGGLEDAGALVAAMVAAEKLEPGAGWIDIAHRVATSAAERFAGPGGVLFDTASGRDDLFVRPRSTHDGATPSGQSHMLNALIDLAMAAGETEGARGQLAAVSSAVAQNPVGAAGSTRGLVRMIRSGMIEASDGAEYEDSRSADLPVEIYASEERVSVGPDAPAELKLVLKIREGFHIVAAEAGSDGGGLLPLRVGLIPGSGSGVAVYADYPEGEAYSGAALGDDVRVHSGEVEISVAVERSAQQWTGRPLLGVTYQACSDTECREPVTVELDISVDLVGSAG